MVELNFKNITKDYRATKSSILQFGLINIPVKLVSLKQQEPIQFHNVCPDCKERISYKRWCNNCQKEVDYKEMLKGYYISKSTPLQIFTQEEIKAIKEFEKAKGLEVKAFIPTEDIPFYLFDTTYNLIPANEQSIKAFVLFRKALELSGLSAVGKFTMKEREHIFLIRAYQGRLFLTILLYPHRARVVDKIDCEVSQEEQNLALELVKRLTTNFNELHCSGFTKDLTLERFEEALKVKMAKGVKVEEGVERVRAFKDLQSLLIESIKKVEKNG
jgi:DNA end-binding protein Ku